MKRSIGLAAAAVIAVSMCGGCSREETAAPPAAEYTEIPDAAGEEMARGAWSAVPEDIRKQMRGVSMPENASVTFEDLAYLNVPHYNYSGERKIGHMVTSRLLADEVLDIFADLYEAEFPIERMEIIDNFVPYIDEVFNNLDRASMGQNNTSSFYYRKINGTDRMSYHAYGRAIDVNPRTNPYVIPSSGYVSPANAYEYADRSRDFPGMIRSGDAVYRAFVSRGWEWGGDWTGEKDYQHFQKPPKK